MSIHFISGKPGGGKTLYSVRLIVDELVRGRRVVITNVSLNLPALNEYLQKVYPKQYSQAFTDLDGNPVHITDRVRIIDDDDLAQFFTFRGNGVCLASVSNTEWKTGKRPDFSTVNDSGVLYVLDEIHIAFNARAWADTGHQVLFYLSQHRKLGDDVICITQAVGNVDKQFRSVAQDYTYIKNLAKQRLGMFNLPSRFIRNTYGQPATETSQPMESGQFSLDVSGIASLYDTAKGVGIHGRAGADTGEKKKGIHWGVLVVGLPLILILAAYFIPKALGHVLTGPVRQSNAVIQNLHQTNAVPAPLAPAPAPVLPDPVPERPQRRSSYVPEFQCVGYTLLDVPTAYFSDGTIVQPPELEVVAKTYVQVSGQRFRIIPPRSSTVTISTAVTSSPPIPVTPTIETFPDLGYQPSVDVTYIGQGRRQPSRRLSGLSPTSHGSNSQ